MHKVDFVVRDHEVYTSGVVHNSIYLCYLEHARNTYLRENGIDFADLSRESNIKFTQVSSKQKYIYPLKANDNFYVTTSIIRISPIQFQFIQKIYLDHNDKLCIEAETIGVLINGKGYPIKAPEVVTSKLEKMGVA